MKVAQTQHSRLDELMELLDSESKKCISCGFCDSVCPTYAASGYDPVITARGRAQLGRKLYEGYEEGALDEVSVSDSFYSCLGCHACVHVCPTGVDAGRVSEIGRMIVASSESLKQQRKAEAGMIVHAVVKSGNPLGLAKECSKWAEGLAFNDGSDTLLYTGSMYQLMGYSAGLSSMRRRFGNRASALGLAMTSRSVTALRFLSRRAVDKDINSAMVGSLLRIYHLLRNSGVEFDYLGSDEPYPGTFLYDLGYEASFRTYARKVSSKFREKRYRQIVTVDPHTHRMLTEIYPLYADMSGINVKYYLDLIDSSKLGRNGRKIMFHEPCLFSMSGSPYDGPKRVLGNVSDVKLPSRSGKRTHCCGGPVELIDGDLAASVSEKRARQLEEAECNGCETVTACPVCYSNLSGTTEVKDISQILSEAVTSVP